MNPVAQVEHAGLSERADLTFSTRRSAEFHRYARQYAPLGVIGGGRYWRPYPLCIAKAKGSYLWDIDGNKYIDYHASYGPSVLGQNNEEVREAVVEAITERAVLFALPHEAEIQLCKKVTELLPSAEKVILTCAGTEATYHAVRVSRAYTGRKRVIKFEGAYHGWHDSVQHSLKPKVEDAGPEHNPTTVPVSAGTLDVMTAETTVLSWNDTEGLERCFAKEGDDLACIIIEPVVHACGVLKPAPGFLERMRELCTHHGVVLIFDEIITAFRHDLGGCQRLFGITPDLTAFGKAIANGYPISGLAGKREIMGLIEPEGPVSYSGTFNGSVIAVAAALKTIEIMEREPVHRRLFEAGRQLSDAINGTIKELGLPAQCESFGSMWCVYFTDRAVRNYRDIAAFAVTKDTGIDADFQTHLLNHGVYIQPFYTNRAFTSYAHSDSDLERTSDAVQTFLRSNGEKIESAHTAAYSLW
ncbi:MAG: aspartate aminotransferase family protein [Solirubrobacteraceae bacterium]